MATGRKPKEDATPNEAKEVVTQPKAKGYNQETGEFVR